MYCPGGNATDPIWRVLATSDAISSWTPLKPQHCNPNPNQSTLVYWLPYSSHSSNHPSQSPCLPWISFATQKLMLDGRKAVLSIPYVLVAFFSSLKQNLIAYRSSKVSSRSVCIFEIHQLWQSGFSWVYSNSCCSCSFEAEIIKINQSSDNIYSNNIENFRASTLILNACIKKVWKGSTCFSKGVDGRKVVLLWLLFTTKKREISLFKMSHDQRSRDCRKLHA